MFTATWPVILLFIIVQASTSNQHPIRSAQYGVYELIYTTDATTELTGSIRIFCRTSITAENVAISEVQFWLNSTTCNSITSLRERTDVHISEVDSNSIKFNLTRDLEGYYTCGKQVGENCEMSHARVLICKYRVQLTTNRNLLLSVPAILLYVSLTVTKCLWSTQSGLYKHVGAWHLQSYPFCSQHFRPSFQ